MNSPIPATPQTPAPQFYTRNELSNIAELNGFGNYYDDHQNHATQKSIWDRVIFNDLLHKQSALRPQYDGFMEKMMEHKQQTKNHLFARLFDGKVEIGSLVPAVFNLSHHCTKTQAARRLPLFKELATRSPEFTDAMVESLKTQSPHSMPDSLLFDAFFQIFKNKKITKNAYSQQELLALNASFSTYDVLEAQKKISFYTSHLFEKNQSLYDTIMADMKNVLQSQGLVELYWQKKLTVFPAHIASQYTALVIPFCEDKKTYAYSLTISYQWFVTHARMKNHTEVTDATAKIYKALSNSIKSRFDVQTHQNMSLDFTATEESVIDRVKAFCQQVVRHLPELIKKDTTLQGIQSIVDQIDKIALSQHLSEALEDKQPSPTGFPATKPKI